MAEAFETKTTEETGRLLHSTDPGGLSAEEARKRLEQYGPNRLQEPEQPGFFFPSPVPVHGSSDLCAGGGRSHFRVPGRNRGRLYHCGGGGLKRGCGDDPGGKAKRALDALKKMTRLKAVVRRDQTDQEIDAAELVPGDLVVLDAGRQVPADLGLYGRKVCGQRNRPRRERRRRSTRTPVFLRPPAFRWETGKTWPICPPM